MQALRAVSSLEHFARLAEVSLDYLDEHGDGGAGGVREAKEEEEDDIVSARGGRHRLCAVATLPPRDDVPRGYAELLAAQHASVLLLTV